jgi:hypothetical protein
MVVQKFMLKRKKFWLFFGVMVFILAVAALIPVLSFVTVAIAHYTITWHEPPVDVMGEYFAFSYWWNPFDMPLSEHFLILVSGFSGDYNYIIPFFAISVTVLIMFLLLPRLKKFDFDKQKKIVSITAVSLFLALQLYAQRVAAIGPALHEMFMSRRVRIYDYEAYMQALADSRIPFTVQIHYYVLSVILVLFVVHWLYGFAETRYGSGKPGVKQLVVHGLIMACYIVAFVWIRTELFYEMYVQTFAYGQTSIFGEGAFSFYSSFWFAYNYYDYTLYLTWESVVIAGSFFALAGVAAGLFSALHMHSEERAWWMSPCIGMATVFALYVMQFFLYGRRSIAYTNAYGIRHWNYWVVNEVSPERVGVLPPVQIAFIILTGVALFLIIELATKFNDA